MDKSKAAEHRDGHEAADDEQPSSDGFRSRLTRRLGLRCAAWLDRTIARLGTLRERLAPAAANHDDRHPPRAESPSVVPHGRLRGFLIATTLFLIGLGVGAGFSFKLFAHRLDTQEERILDQADALLHQEKDLVRAERALWKVKDDLKETLQQLEDTGAATEQLKKQLNETDARLSLCTSRSNAAPGTGGAGKPSAPQARDFRQNRKSGSCNLATQSDLGKCLEQFNR
ncbi:MAG: hypothetical protein M0P39_07420 [Rhodocyclaceae bacterium]|nr:hypothetical protein [Rhodocyclaceae bacterium]